MKINFWMIYCMFIPIITAVMVLLFADWKYGEELISTIGIALFLLPWISDIKQKKQRRKTG